MKMPTCSMVCAFCLIILALNGCGGNAESSHINQESAAVANTTENLVTIKETFPSDAENNIQVSEALSVTFSENILKKDITITVNKLLSVEPIDIKLTVLDNKVFFIPDIPFEYNSEYVVNISASSSSSLNVNNQKFSFKTISPDPKVIRGFHPPLLERGQTNFLVAPIESVLPRESTKVSFGVPFPKGFLTNIEEFRILDEQGHELAISARELLPWRAMKTKDESIRSILVQTDIIFEEDKYGKSIPKKLTLEWGVPRQFISNAFTPIKNTWVLVDDANYPAKENVFEPKAYAVFSAQWYGDSVIKTRILPTGTHEGFSAYDTAFELFGNTTINNVDPRVIDDNLIPHSSSYAAWLFDRAMTIYQLAFKTGKLRFLREGHRATQFYLNHVGSKGFFNLKSFEDMKYSYGESLVTNFILSGDDRIPNIVTSMVPAWDTFNSDYKLTTNFWTERHAAFQLKGYISAYELTGNLNFKDKAFSTFANLLKMQSNPVPGAPITGAMMHTAQSHGEGGEQFIASPWMSALLVDAVERFYIQFQDARAIDFVLKLANFFKQDGVALYEWKGYKGKDSFYVPYYLAGHNLTVKQHGGEGAGSLEHGLDVSKILSLAYYFSCLNDLCDNSYLIPLSKLYKTATEFTLPYWIRTAAPESGLASYRLAPPRKFNWWFNTTSNMDFLLSGTSLMRSPLNLNIETIGALPEFYYPGQTFNISLKVNNLGDIAAKNIVIDNKILKTSVPGLIEISDISNGGILNPEGVVWHLSELKGRAESAIMSFKVTVKQFPVIPSTTRPLAKIISRTHLRYCSYLDSIDICNLWHNYWSQGSQTITSNAQWSVIKATPPDTPPVINIITPVDNDTVIGMTTILVEVTDEDKIGKVDFILDDKLIQSYVTAPFEHNFNSNALSKEPHTLTVKAWDVFGSLASKSVTLNPGNPDRKAPDVSITSPARNQEYCGPIIIDYQVEDDFAIQSCELLLAGANVVIPSCGQYTLFSSIPLFSSKAHLTFDKLAQSVISQDGLNLVGVPHNLITEDGVNSSAYHFNGVDSNIDFSRTSLNINNDITVSFWMKPSRDEGVIVSQDWNYIGAEQGWAISLGANNHESNNALSITWSSGDYKNNANAKNVVQTEANKVLLNKWQNITIRKIDTLVDIFIDGVLITSKNIAFSNIAWPFNAERQLSIGKGMNHPDMYNRNFEGALDDLAIWDRALTDVEIQKLYKQEDATMSHTLKVFARDEAGNIGSSSVDFSIKKCSN